MKGGVRVVISWLCREPGAPLLPVVVVPVPCVTGGPGIVQIGRHTPVLRIEGGVAWSAVSYLGGSLHLVRLLCQLLLSCRELVVFPVHQQGLVRKRGLGQLVTEPLDHVLDNLVFVHLHLVRHVLTLGVLRLVTKQAVNLPATEMSVRVQFVYNPVRHALLVDLPVVDLLLERVVGDQSVHVSILLLTVSEVESS